MSNVETTANAPTIDEALAEGLPPEGEAPSGEPAGQAEAEGTPTEQAELLDVNEYGDRMVTVKVDGEEVTVPLSEAIQGYQRQADYTRKTQELAQERQMADQLRALQAALENNPDTTIQVLQQTYGVAAAQQMVDAAGEQAQTDAQAGEGDWSENDPVVQRLRAFEERFSEFERFQAQQMLDRTLGGLQEKYGDDFNAHEVMAAALERGVTDVSQLEAVYKQMAFDKVYAMSQAQRDAAAQREAEDRQRQAAKEELSGTVSDGPGVAGNVTAPPVSQPTTVAEAWALAKAQGAGAA